MCPGGILITCPNHFHTFLSKWFIGSTSSSIWKPEVFILSLKMSPFVQWLAKHHNHLWGLECRSTGTLWASLPGSVLSLSWQTSKHISVDATNHSFHHYPTYEGRRRRQNKWVKEHIYKNKKKYSESEKEMCMWRGGVGWWWYEIKGMEVDVEVKRSWGLNSNRVIGERWAVEAENTQH